MVLSTPKTGRQDSATKQKVGRKDEAGAYSVTPFVVPKPAMKRQCTPPISQAVGVVGETTPSPIVLDSSTEGTPASGVKKVRSKLVFGPRDPLPPLALQIEKQEKLARAPFFLTPNPPNKEPAITSRKMGGLILTPRKQAEERMPVPSARPLPFLQMTPRKPLEVSQESLVPPKRPRIMMTPRTIEQEFDTGLRDPMLVTPQLSSKEPASASTEPHHHHPIIDQEAEQGQRNPLILTPRVLPKEPMPFPFSEPPQREKLTLTSRKPVVEEFRLIYPVAPEDDERVFGRWESKDIRNPHILSRQFDKVVEVKFQEGVVKFSRDTIERAKRTVKGDDFRTSDTGTVSASINRFFNVCHNELFQHLQVKTIAYTGDLVSLHCSFPLHQDFNFQCHLL